jgi:phosphate:Na+ symporter
MLDVVVGAVLTVLAYSSLAVVLLIATLATSAVIPVTVALGLVIGANIGSGILAMLATANASSQVRRLPLGNLIFKALGAVLFIVFLPQVHILLQQLLPSVHQQVIGFHLAFNLVLAVVFIGCTGLIGRTVDRWLADPHPGAGAWRPRHLDPLALNACRRSRSRARRARRCTRPTSSRPCCAASCRCCARTT